MIHQIFIAEAINNKLIYGDSNYYPSKLKYPIMSVFNKRLVQLKIDNIILSLLYSDYDNFTASKYLLDIKKIILDKGILFSVENIKKNYFILLDLLENIELKFYKENNVKNLNQKIYIKVIENIDCIISNKKLIKNNIYGEINCKNMNKGEIIIKKSENLILKSENDILDENNKEIISVKKINNNNNLLAYLFFESDKILFDMKKSNNSFTFTCNLNLIFKYLEIKIPVPDTTFSANCEHKNGVSTLDLENNYVIYKFINHNFVKKEIKIETKTLKDQFDQRSIKIKFLIEDYNQSLITIMKVNSETENQEAFVKYILKSNDYEIRQI